MLTIALGIGSSASVQGFVRGLVAPHVPLPEIDTVVSLFALDRYLAAGPISYHDYLSFKGRSDLFQSLGAGRESQDNVVLSGRSSLLSVAAVTADLATLFHLPLADGVVVSHRMWQVEFDARDVRGLRLRVNGVDTRIDGIAPEELDGLYRGRAVDVWMPLREASAQDMNGRSRSFWVLGRLRAGVTTDRAQVVLNANRSGADAIAVLPYTGLTPEAAGGMWRTSVLLRFAAGAVFVIACANVASFLLARASARSVETAVRVAIGAGRLRLARGLLADSVLVSVAGGTAGVLLAAWTTRVVPTLFFEEDAEHLVFAPDLGGIVATSAACAGLTIVCGLLPLLEMPNAGPAAVLQRESAGPSKAMRRLRTGLVLMQMTCCSLLVISTGLLLQGFRAALQTTVGQRLGEPIVATVEAAELGTRGETFDRGRQYFREVEQAARSVVNVAGTTWTAMLPGARPAWHALRVEPPQLPLRDVVLNVAVFSAASLAHITLPPVAGRMFGASDTGGCKVVIVNEEAARALFDGEAVGRWIEDPAGQRVEISAVVSTRRAEQSSARTPPTVYYYAEQMDPPLGRVGAARFRAPILPKQTSVTLDVNVVSPGYFDAMGLRATAGNVDAKALAGGCRVGVINQEAAELYFGGNAVGGAVIDAAGRRTDIVGVVRSTLLRAAQRRVEPTIYFPMAQDFLPRMTLLLDAPAVDRRTLDALRRRLALVPGGMPGRLVVTTLDAHLSKTALAPERIATVLVGAFAATALALGILGLYGVMNEATRRRRREFALRLALGAQGWRVVRQVLVEGLQLAGAGTLAGMLGSLLVMRWLARIAPSTAPFSIWEWLAAPLALGAVAALAGVLPARRALSADPLTIMRDT